MKQALIFHRQVITKYYRQGVLVVPDAQEKLLHAIYGGTLTSCTTIRETPLARVGYKTKGELEEKYWEAVRLNSNIDASENV